MLNAQAQTLPTLPSLVDEFAELHGKVQAAKPMLDRYETLRKILADAADQQAPGADARLEGHIGFAVFSKPALVRSVPAEKMETLYKLIGKTAFLRSTKASVSAVEKLLSATEQAEVFAVAVGARKVKDAGTVHSELFADLKGALRLVK